MQLHDVQRIELRIRGGKGSRNDGEIFCHVVGDTEGGQGTTGHQHLLTDMHHFDQLGWVRV